MKKVMMIMAMAGMMLSANAQTAQSGQKEEPKKDAKATEHSCSKDCKKDCSKDKKTAACGEKGHVCTESCKKK